MRYFLLFYLLIAVLVVSAMGLRLPGLSVRKFKERPYEVFNDMDDQSKQGAQRESTFFADGSGARMPVPGTVPMGYKVPESPGAPAELDGFALGESYLETGKMGDMWGDGLPNEIEVDENFVKLGRKKFDVYCAICHGRSGNGNGVIKYAGFVEIIDLVMMDQATRPDGKIYDIIVNGQGNMKSYGASLTLRERWAVVAYVRVLQNRGEMPAALVQAEWDARVQADAVGATEDASGNTERNSNQ